MLVEHGDGCTSCRIHNRRPDNCRYFPLDARDVHERDIQMPLSTCGYFFADDGETPEE
jgi:Fe-S-cluster containining protein